MILDRRTFDPVVRFSQPDGPTTIRTSTVFPAHRENVELRTADGHRLVGELALPEPGEHGDARHPASAADARRLHGLAHPAQGRLAAAGPRRPRRAPLQHPGHVVAARHQRRRVRAGRRRAARRRAADGVRRGARPAEPLAARLVVRHRAGAQVRAEPVHPIDGAILLSPPLHRATDVQLAALGGRAASRWWSLVPEHDDYLRRRRGGAVRRCRRPRVVAVDGAKHLWVGETYNAACSTRSLPRWIPAARRLSAPRQSDARSPAGMGRAGATAHAAAEPPHPRSCPKGQSSPGAGVSGCPGGR